MSAVAPRACSAQQRETSVPLLRRVTYFAHRVAVPHTPFRPTLATMSAESPSELNRQSGHCHVEGDAHLHDRLQAAELSLPV